MVVSRDPSVDVPSVPQRIPPGNVQPRGWTAGFALAAAVLIGLALAAGAARLFSSFAWYDDEGYVMISVRSFLEGKPLYDATYTQYGPAQFAIVGGLHWLTGLPISHDITRLKTLVVWMTAAGLCALIVGRISQSRWGALCAGVLAFLHLERLAMEPGHPQELCLLAMLGVLAASTWLDARWKSVWLWSGIGLLAAVVLATKVNLGVYLTLGIVLAIAAQRRHGFGQHWLTTAIILGACALPWLLMRKYLTTWEGAQLATVVTVGITTWWRWEREAPAAESLNESVGWRQLAPLVAALLVGWIGLVAVALWHGTTWAGMYDGLVGQNLRFAGFVQRLRPLYPWAAASAVAALVVSRSGRRDPLWPAVASAVGLVLVAWQDGLDTFLPLRSGIYDRGHARLLVSLATPWAAWLLLSRDETASRPFARRMLVAAAVLQPLTAFPIAGTQMAVGSLPLLLILTIAAAEGLRRLAESPDTVLTPDTAWWGARLDQVGRLLPWGIGAVLLVRAAWLALLFSQMQPLDLPGARWLRQPPSSLTEKRELATLLRESSDTFLCVQAGYCSLYFWSEVEPPTGYNTTVWPYLFGPERQAEIVASLERHSQAAIVFDTNELPPASMKSVVLEYVREHYEPTERVGKWEIWRKRDPSRKIAAAAP
jgi:hypothetical protein